MPRYYCDYCDTYLTHDSPSVRKQHNAGYKHKANVRSYYQQFEEQQTQSLIDQKVKEHLGQTAAYQQQVGAAFHQHLTTLQYKPPISAPVLPPPPLPIPGTISASSASPLLPIVRPPVLPRPTGATPGFGVAPTFRPPVASTMATPGAQSNGLPRPPTLAPPGAPGVRPVMSSSTASANGPLPGPPQSGPPGSFQQQSTPSSGTHGNYSYPAPQLGSSAGYMIQRPNLTPTANPTPTPSPTPTPLTLNPNINPTYSSQQPSRVAPPAGSIAQGSLTFGQGTFGPSSATQSTSSSYGPSPPGGPIGYRS